MISLDYNSYILSDSMLAFYYPRFLEPWYGDYGWHKRLNGPSKFTVVDKNIVDQTEPVKICLAITGPNRIGKDWLGYELKKLDSRFVPLGIADLLKCKLATEFNKNWGLTAKQAVELVFEDKTVKKIGKEQVRELYKFYGEMSKSIHGKDLWANQTVNRIQLLIRDNKIPVITDLRFPEEKEVLLPWIKELVTLEKAGDNEAYLKEFKLDKWK